MADVVTILLAFISVGVTIIGGVLGFIAYQFLDMRRKLQILWNDYFGVDAANGDGFREEITDDHDSMRDMLEEAKQSHDSIRAFLCDLSDYLEKNDSGNPPHAETYELDDD